MVHTLQWRHRLDADEKSFALNKKFHGYEDVEEDNEPEYIESDFGDLIINPKYNNDNDLKNAKAKLKQYEEEYNNIQPDDEMIELKHVLMDVLLKKYHNNIQIQQQIGFTNMPDEIGGVADPSIMTYYNQVKIVTR